MASINTLPSAGNKVRRPAFLGAAAVAGALAVIIAGAVTAQTPTTPVPAQQAAATPAVAVKPASAPSAKAPAAAALAKPLWVSLSPAQKTALEPLVGEWDRMEAPRKQKWLEIANRFASMKPDEQARVHEKMREWVKMTPDERRLVRENYTKAKKLDVTQKSEQWEKYQQLPEEQKQKLAAEAAKSKKQLTNLPPPTQAGIKPLAPIKHAQPACPAGSVKNPALAMPAAPGAAAIAPCVATAPAAPANTAAAAVNAPANAK